jgi:hypothetical protein
MMGRRGLPPFEGMKMRTEEELAACGGGGARGSNSCGIRIQRLVITKDATIILLSPCSAVLSSLARKGGGLNSDLTGMREEDGPFPPSHPHPPPFPSLCSPPLLPGHLRR